MLVYDCEIKKAILGKKNEAPIDGIEYCAGWHDHANMGISCICAYDYDEDRYRIFLEDNLDDFADLAHNRETLIGFNSIGFDNKLCLANGLEIPTDRDYDVLVEIWKAAGLGPEFRYPSHIGFGLDACLKANFPGLQKSGNGALAPVLYQQGQLGQVVDYCLNDVRLTKKLVDHIEQFGWIKDPRNPGNNLIVERPPVLS